MLSRVALNVRESAWIPPFTGIGHERFPAAKELFEAHGFSDLEYCDMDKEPNERQLARLDRNDILYLTGGDPIGFRLGIQRVELPTRLRQFLADGGLNVGASGGAMQLTKNVSLFRLLTESFEEVFANREEYEGLGLVDYEILPHLNRLDASFLETVQPYSERVTHDVIALADGATLLHSGDHNYRCIGQAKRLSKGVWTQIETTA